MTVLDYAKDERRPPSFGADLRRGERFASDLYALVQSGGPLELSPTEREALAAHLLSSAVGWVQARNLSQASGGAQ